MLVTIEWLKNRLDDPQIVIIDCRFDLADSEAGLAQYQEGHIPKALYLDLEKDLSSTVKQHGGRHPLPDFDRLADQLGSYGIDHRKHVIIYDNQAGGIAARCWWLLTYMGHPQVSLLDGGYDAWVKKGYPVSRAIQTPEATTFVPNFRSDWIAEVEEVKQASEKGSWLIDSRDPDRYQGKMEPIDKRAGHIPGARNHFWKRNLQGDQQWKSAAELQADWAYLRKAEQPIVYCGSGVTACANLFALHLAGITQVKLYPGSWSDWISFPDNPIAKEE